MTTYFPTRRSSDLSKVDDAIIALSSLMTSMVTARRESGAPAKTGQATILRLAKAQMSLVDVSSDVLRIHGDICALARRRMRSEEHTSELQSLMRISYAVFCLKKNRQDTITT